MTVHRVGLIVNPVAGLGGPVGLKGTDGALATQARLLGATPRSSSRAAIALAALQGLESQILTCAGEMGEAAARKAQLATRVIYSPPFAGTSGLDTTAAARCMQERNIDLLLFAGGDGTARDVLEGVGASLPALGIPTGVKMHSAVFAVSARASGDVARCFLDAANRSSLLHDAEVVDRLSSTDADDAGSPVLHGFLRTPQVSFLVPRAKCAARPDEEAATCAAAVRVAQLARDDRITLVGPGSTMRRVKAELGDPGSLLGVAIFQHGRCLITDASEAQILHYVADRPARLIVSIVGGQGFLFGRGNQQLSARVLRAVGRENIIVIASVTKLAMLPAGALLVDTGDDQVDASLSGYLPIMVDAGHTVVVAVRHVAAKPWEYG